MRSARSRAAAITARLTAAGMHPRRRNGPRRIRIQTEVPGPNAAPELWPEVLDALAEADAFGLDTGAGGQTAWAVVNKRTPATEGVRGRGHQL